MPVRSLFVCTGGASVDRPALYSVNLISPISTALRRPHDAIYTERSLPPPCVCVYHRRNISTGRARRFDDGPTCCTCTCLLFFFFFFFFFFFRPDRQSRTRATGNFLLPRSRTKGKAIEGGRGREFVSTKEISKFLEALTTGRDRRHRQALIGGIQRQGSGR